MKTQNNIPALRFPEFDGEWEKKKLGDVCLKIQDGNYGGDYPKSEEFIEYGIPFLTSKALGGDGFIKKDKIDFISEEKHKKLKKAQLKLDDVLFTNRGSNVGSIGYVDISFAHGNIGPQLTLMRSDLKIITPVFLYQIMKSDTTLKQIRSQDSGSAMNFFGIGSTSKFKLTIPTLPEQQKIASFLSAVDEKIQQLTRKVALLEQYKKGIMQQLFSGALRFKDEDSKDFPEWEEKKLGEVGKIISGLTYSPDDIYENGVLVLRSSNVKNRNLTFNDNVYVNVKQGSFNPVELNDILICVRNGSKHLIGKNALINKESEGVAFGAFMSVYRSKYNLFIFHYFDTDLYKKEVNKNLGATINSINGSDLKKFKIPFPSLKEQQKIASFLSGIDGKIASVKAQLEKTQRFKKGLLQGMFV